MTEGYVPGSFFTVVPGRLPGLNEIVSAARTHKFRGAKQKREETSNCIQTIKIDLDSRAEYPVFGEPVDIWFGWYEPNLKRDPDNIRAGSKFLLDALVKLGIIPDDSQKWVNSISDEFHVDKEYPRIEVRVTPWTAKESA